MITDTEITEALAYINAKANAGKLSTADKNKIIKLRKELDMTNADIIPTPFDKPITVNKVASDDNGGLHSKDVTIIPYSKVDRVISSKLVKPKHTHSLKLFLYIISHIHKNTNYVYIDVDEYGIKYTISKRDRLNSIDELVALEVLKRTNIQGLFVINHNYIYNGNIDYVIQFMNKGLNVGFTVVDNKVIYDKETKKRILAKVGVHKSRFKTELELV